MLKLKVRATDKVFFDGTWISNGHWAYKKGFAHLSDKALQTLVETNIVFSRRSKVLDTGEAAHVPNFDRIMSTIHEDDPAIGVSKFLHMDVNGDLLRIVKRQDKTIQLVSEEYTVLIDHCLKLNQRLNGAPIAGWTGEDLMFVVMPCRLAGRDNEEIYEQLAQLAVPPEKQEGE